ncbi:MAG: CinA family nicotinamide mononucleotide deamidase-related protein, partial [Chloroflexi bacterium]|nr:CinA family nicotinamide mononucleotide deamidase-related protein [Chloroflexota bacterium]
MRAEIISIGTEILMGEILDTNANYMAQRLPAMGIDLYFMHQIGDNRERLVELIQTARSRSDVVILTGGLGPTEDDITRDAIAESVGEEPYVVPELEAHLRNFFERRGGHMPAQNVKQATIIPSGESIPNPRGTAPGWWVEKDGAIVIAMPGPPAEMTGMWENDVAPRLKSRSDGTVLISRTLKTTGLGESMLDELLGDLRHAEDPTVGVYHKADGVHVRLASKASYEDIARERIAPAEQQIRSMLGDAIWGSDEDTFQEAVAALLKDRGLSIAVMESCTGGLLA